MSLWRAIRDLITVPSLPSGFVEGDHTYRFSVDESPPMPIDTAVREGFFGGAGRVSRELAISVPAVQRGRNLICSLSTLPLIVQGPANAVVDNPLIRQIDPDRANLNTLADTIEDLLFEKYAYWRITARDFAGFPVAAQYVPFHLVNVREDKTIWIDGKKVAWSDVIQFESPNPALLVHGARAIRRAVLLERASEMYAGEPRMDGFFTPSEGADPAEDDEIDAMLNKFAEHRKNRRSGYVPAALKWNDVQQPTPADLQLVQIQDKVTKDLANAMGLDPEDLAVSTTSRTYQNAVDRRRDRINDTLSPYMQAITARLSMQDVTRRGYVVAWDLDDYLRADPKTRWEVYEIGLRMGAITIDEIRQEERMPELTPAQRIEAQPPIRAQATVTREIGVQP